MYVCKYLFIYSGSMSPIKCIHYTSEKFISTSTPKVISYLSKYCRPWFIFVSLIPIGIDWMLCPPKIHILKFNSPCDGVWRWDPWEVIRSWWLPPHQWGQCPDKRDLRESSLVPSATWGYKKWSSLAVSELESAPTSDTETTGALILDFPAPRPSMRNKLLLFINSPFYGILLRAIGMD